MVNVAQFPGGQFFPFSGTVLFSFVILGNWGRPGGTGPSNGTGGTGVGSLVHVFDVPIRAGRYQVVLRQRMLRPTGGTGRRNNISSVGVSYSTVGRSLSPLQDATQGVSLVRFLSSVSVVH